MQLDSLLLGVIDQTPDEKWVHFFDLFQRKDKLVVAVMYVDDGELAIFFVRFHVEGPVNVELAPGHVLYLSSLFALQKFPVYQNVAVGVFAEKYRVAAAVYFVRGKFALDTRVTQVVGGDELVKTCLYFFAVAVAYLVLCLELARFPTSEQTRDYCVHTNSIKGENIGHRFLFRVELSSRAHL